MSVVVITDSTSYISPQLRAELDIQVVSLSVNFGVETYLETQISHEWFYHKLSQEKKLPTSSQPTPADFYAVFKEQVANQQQVVGIFISSDMSGTYATATTAKDMVLEEYPQATIVLIDSRSNCMELGLAVIAAARSAKAGESLDKVMEQAIMVMDRSRFIFTPDTLMYLKKGGRIGGASALLGSLLQIKPILTVEDGKTAILSKVRTKQKAISTITQTFLQDVEKKGLGEAVIHHIENEAEGKLLAKELEEKLGQSFPLCSIGPVIGLHVGPGAIGIAYYTKDI